MINMIISWFVSEKKTWIFIFIVISVVHFSIIIFCTIFFIKTRQDVFYYIPVSLFPIEMVLMIISGICYEKRIIPVLMRDDPESILMVLDLVHSKFYPYLIKKIESNQKLYDEIINKNKNSVEKILIVTKRKRFVTSFILHQIGVFMFVWLSLVFVASVLQ